MRQLAWLGTAPDVEHHGPGKPPEPVTRLERRRGNGEAIILPPNPAPYLTDWFFEVGPSRSGGMAEAPIDYRDLAAWQAINGVELQPWEAKLLRRLSRDYVAERVKARDPAAIEPFAGQEIVDMRDKVSAQFEAMFAALKRKAERAGR